MHFNNRPDIKTGVAVLPAALPAVLPVSKPFLLTDKNRQRQLISTSPNGLAHLNFHYSGFRRHEGEHQRWVRE